MPNKFSRFWQDLKRRNVIRVITVYTGAAFVILSLVDMVREPFELPNWSFKLIVVLLSIGLIIAVILSWIYDIHPEGGIVKTEPADKIRPEEPPRSSKGWKVASYVSFVVIVGLIILNIFPRNNKETVPEILDKSIAVLPFINDSEDQENEHFINGIMDELLINLQTIKELRVPGRTSTEQYRNHPKPIPEIASEMNVAYIVEGSGQRYGDNIRLRVQLVEGATDRHLWAKSYEEVIKGPEEIFRIQSEIAQLIAAELHAVISPAEKELIEKVPTTSISALDLYQRGNEAYWRYWSGESGTEALERAEYFFNEALDDDSTFAQAYTGLARIYWGSEGYFSENYLDTVRVLLDKALSYDPGLAEAHTLYGRYYNALNDTARAMREVNKAIALNPNDWEAYRAKAGIGSDYINSISNLQKAVQLNRGPELPILLKNLGWSYAMMGFFEKAMDLNEEKLLLTGDSIAYLNRMGLFEALMGNLNGALDRYKQSLALDSVQPDLDYQLFFLYNVLGEKEQALAYGKRWVERLKASDESSFLYPMRIGTYYRLQGLQEKADYYYNLQIEYCLREIELHRGRAEQNLSTYYDLASTYAVTGQTEKALENLRIWIKRPDMPTNILIFLKYDPHLNPIRENPEFQQILKEAEDKFNAEHERVRQWLEENEML
jgi:TolB-like protein/Tfp pilus assembly protein PilF